MDAHDAWHAAQERGGCDCRVGSYCPPEHDAQERMEDCCDWATHLRLKRQDAPAPASSLHSQPCVCTDCCVTRAVTAALEEARRQMIPKVWDPTGLSADSCILWRDVHRILDSLLPGAKGRT